MKISDLKPAEYNPRRISDKRGRKAVMVVCCICGCEFPKAVSAVSRTRNGKISEHCCSIKCRIVRQKETVTGQNSKAWKGGPVKQNCFICGAEFSRKRDQIETRNSIFCSTACFGIWKSKTWRNENHPRWRGGYKYKNGEEVYHRDRWASIRASIRKRDDNKCTKCGKSGPGLHVHHKRPLRFFDNPDEANLPDNLITLCHTCHAKEENILRAQEDRQHVQKTTSSL